MSKTKVKISRLCLEIDGKKIDLTLKQAKELKDVLNDTFGEETTVYRDRWHYPYYPWTSPYWTCNATSSITSSGPNVAISDSTFGYASDNFIGSVSGNTLYLAAQ